MRAKMWGYAKSLMAVGLALIAVAGAGYWSGSRTRVLTSLEKERQTLRTQTVAADADAALARSLKERLTAVRSDIEKTAAGFMQKNQEGPVLLNAVVRAASVCEMEMTGAAEAPGVAQFRKTNGAAVGVNVVTYEISLRGTYSGLVKFLQNIAQWEVRHRIESLEISTHGDAKDAEEIEAVTVLSLFSR